MTQLDELLREADRAELLRLLEEQAEVLAGHVSSARTAAETIKTLKSELAGQAERIRALNLQIVDMTRLTKTLRADFVEAIRVRSEAQNNLTLALVQKAEIQALADQRGTLLEAAELTDNTDPADVRKRIVAAAQAAMRLEKAEEVIKTNLEVIAALGGDLEKVRQDLHDANNKMQVLMIETERAKRALAESEALRAQDEALTQARTQFIGQVGDFLQMLLESPACPLPHKARARKLLQARDL